ncbi:MAG: DUF695 domain-containing protein [Planctomycetota bacterium]
MPREWDFYITRIDGAIASVLVDLGAHGSAPRSDRPVLARLRIELLSPTPQGFPGEAESQTLTEMEVTIERELTEGGTTYVGRCSSGGRRDLFYYLAEADSWQGRVTEILKAFPDYEAQIDVRDDPEWQFYFGSLFPGPSELQQIRSRHVCDTLRNHGDKLTQPREIEHKAYFPEASHRDSFVTAVEELGYTIQSSSPAIDAEHFAVHFTHQDVPTHSKIEQVVTRLCRLAEEHRGAYDGWGCAIVK